jgi:hypothetical protein
MRYLAIFICFVCFDAAAVMGAADQTEAEKRLSECDNETECREAYDAIFGDGAYDHMMEKLEDNSKGWDWENA